jgi:hypothetical protein
MHLLARPAVFENQRGCGLRMNECGDRWLLVERTVEWRHIVSEFRPCVLSPAWRRCHWRSGGRCVVLVLSGKVVSAEGVGQRKPIAKEIRVGCTVLKAMAVLFAMPACVRRDSSISGVGYRTRSSPE